MLSCLENTDKEHIEIAREKELRSISYAFLKQIILNMCILEGTGGNIDSAFKINRQLIIASVLKDIAKELEESNGSS